MTTLDDLFDLLDLEAAIDAGFVRVQTHPTLPLVIHNYSELAQFERAWTPITRQCRGLISHADTGEVLARPYRKFFNHGEPGAPVAALDDEVAVTDKLDGSLGIGYPTGDGGYAIATRGSFASEQAQHATALFQNRYADTVSFPPWLTPLWEIVYPSNRIVVDYGDLDDLVLHGGVDIRTGETKTAAFVAGMSGWAGPMVDTFPYRTFAEALSDPPRDNREGIVVHFPVTDERVKVKYERYVELHRIVTGMNERVVWEHLGAGKPLAELLEPLPEEFHPWVTSVADRLQAAAADLQRQTQIAHERLLGCLDEGWSRKDYALAAASEPLRPWMFLLLDGRDPGPKIWRTLRPSGAVTMTATEEAA